MCFEFQEMYHRRIFSSGRESEGNGYAISYCEYRQTLTHEHSLHTGEYVNLRTGVRIATVSLSTKRVLTKKHLSQLPCVLHPTSALYAQALQAEFAVYHECE